MEFSWQGAQDRSSVFFVGQAVGLPGDDVIGEEAFVVHTDGVHLVPLQIQLDVLSSLKRLVAHWTTGIVSQPLVNTGVMVNVEAAQHLAVRIVNNGLHAYDALLHHELSVLHSNQNLLQFIVLLRWETLVYLQPCTQNELVIRRPLCICLGVGYPPSVPPLLVYFIVFGVLARRRFIVVIVLFKRDSVSFTYGCFVNERVYMVAGVSIHLVRPLLPEVVEEGNDA